MHKLEVPQLALQSWHIISNLHHQNERDHGCIVAAVCGFVGGGYALCWLRQRAKSPFYFLADADEEVHMYLLNM